MNMTSTHLERERAHAHEKCLLAEWEQKLRNIILLMRRYEFASDELEPLLQEPR